MDILENKLLLAFTVLIILSVVVFLLPLKIRAIIFLLPAWFFPHRRGRVFFHRLRGVNIGSDVEIGYMVSIDNVYPDKVFIEKGATIVLGSIILSHDNAQNKVLASSSNVGEVAIGSNSFVGANCIILPGVKIGKKSIVSAGSVVHTNVPENTVVGGNPAIKLYKLK